MQKHPGASSKKKETLGTRSERCVTSPRAAAQEETIVSTRSDLREFSSGAGDAQTFRLSAPEQWSAT